MQATLYCDLGGQTLAESLGGGGFSFPPLVENDEVTLRLRFQARGDNEWFETDREVFALQAALGLVDARPTGGAFYLPFPGGEGVEPLAFDCSADTFKARLAQAMGVSSSTIEAVRESGSLIVYTTNEWDFENQSNTLRPLSFVETERVEVSPGFYRYEIRLVQANVAFTDQFTRELPPAPQVEIIQEAVDQEGVVIAQVETLTFSPWFRGVYRLRLGSRATRELSMIDGPDEVAAALQESLWTPAELADGAKFEVSDPVDYVLHIVFGGGVAGREFDPLTVEVVQTPPGDVALSLDLKRPELRDLLRAKPAVEVEFLIKLQVADDSAAENDLEARRWVTAYRGPVRLVRSLTRPRAGAELAIPWLRPPSPKDYLPFSRNQVIVGTRHAVVPLGAGLEQEVQHGLGTVNLAAVMIRENVIGGRRLRDDEFSVAFDSADSLTLTLSIDGNPTLAPGAYVAIIAAAGPEEHFLSHNHEIGQVDGLQVFLDNLAGRLDAVESLIPLGALAARQEQTGEVMRWTLPKVFRVFPTREEIAPFSSIAALDVKGLRGGGLLQALNDSTADSLPVVGGLVAEPLPQWAGVLYRNDTVFPVTLPGGLGRKSTVLQPAEFATVFWDNFAGVGYWYRLTNYGESYKNTFYPSDFEFTLFEIPVTSEAFSLRRELFVDFCFEAAILKTAARAQLSIVVEFGDPDEDTGPVGPVQPNFSVIKWDRLKPALNKRLYLTPLPTVHRFGVRVRRFLSGGEDTVETSAIVYGSESVVEAAPVKNDFVLRARFCRFDANSNQMENATGPTQEWSPVDSRGLLAIRGLDVSSGEGDGPGFAVIR